MDTSVGSAIEKIKLIEQDQEAKLKERRELEATMSSLKKAIRETLLQTEKAKLENNELVKRTDRMRAQLEVDKIQRDALAQQLEASYALLQELRSKSDQGISDVWQKRSSLCQTVQSISDDCDVWALLSKPLQTKTVVPIDLGADNAQPVLENEGRLKDALARRERAKAERDRLMFEPDQGEEFVRIKNALRYSLEMMANIRK